MKEKRKPELLAPAGNLETFFSAYDMGADAVYLGLRSFSARARAKNFSLKELATLMPYAHSMGKKVYVALNTIVKETELSQMIDTLAAFSQLGVDAVIIQDLGIYYLAKTYFPELTLHASTQMTVHNSAGVNQLGDMGFKRVVLSREMTLEEINKLKKKTSVEVETFVHGSMCFCYAGSCFFSSYLGGKSSNRGACTQPCRQEYKEGGQDVNPFSMGDLSSLEVLPILMKSDIASFKIEGRMKSVEYVSSVVKSYRMVMDSTPENLSGTLDEAKKILKNAMGRKKTTGFFLSARPTSITMPLRSGNTGRFAGKIIKSKGKEALIKTAFDLHLRDRLRIQSIKTGGRTPFSLSKMRVNGKEVKIALKGSSVEISAPHALHPGDLVFKTTSHEHRNKNVEAKRRLDRLPEKKVNADQRLIKKIKKECLSAPIFNNKTVGLKGTFVKIKDIKELYSLPASVDGIIIILSKAVIHNLRKSMKRLKSMKEKIYWSLPVVIQEDDLTLYHDVIAYLDAEGFKRWQLSNIAHFYLLKKIEGKKITSQYLHSLNALAAFQLHELGCQRIVLSVESDMDNFRALSERGLARCGEIIVYSNLPLYISRVKFDKKSRKGFSSDRGKSYFVKEKDGLTFVYSNNPVSLLSYQKRFIKMGFNAFQIDMSGEGGIEGGFNALMKSLKKGEGLEESSQLNLETGLA